MKFNKKSEIVGKVVTELLKRNHNFKDVEIFEKDLNGIFKVVENWDNIQEPYYCMAKYKGYSHTWMFLPDLEIIYGSLVEEEGEEEYAVEYHKNTLKIGCTTKTVEEWDDISTRELMRIGGRVAVEAYESHWEEVYMKWCSGYRTPYRADGRHIVAQKTPREKKWVGMLRRVWLKRQGVLAPIFHSLSSDEQGWAKFFTGTGCYPYLQNVNETAYKKVVSLMET